MCTTFICCKILAFIARALTAHVLIYCVECLTALRVRCFVSCLYNPLSTENEAVGTESFMYRTHSSASLSVCMFMVVCAGVQLESRCPLVCHMYLFRHVDSIIVPFPFIQVRYVMLNNIFRPLVWLFPLFRCPRLTVFVQLSTFNNLLRALLFYFIMFRSDESAPGAPRPTRSSKRNSHSSSRHPAHHSTFFCAKAERE